MTEFTYRSIVFLLTQRRNGRFVYRDKAHLGGPWSDALKTLDNPSIDRAFKRELTAAIKHFRGEGP